MTDKLKSRLETILSLLIMGLVFGVFSADPWFQELPGLAVLVLLIAVAFWFVWIAGYEKGRREYSNEIRGRVEWK